MKNLYFQNRMPLLRFCKRHILLLSLIFLNACSLAPKKYDWTENKSLYDTHKKTQLEIISWNLRGKIAVNIDGEGGSATLVWSQRGDNYDISLSGPFGGKQVQISGGDGIAQVKDADGNIYRGESIEAVVYNATGWRLPVSHLQYWVRGLSNPEMQSEYAFNEGKLTAIKQDGWQADYDTWQSVGEYSVPRKIKAAKDNITIKAVLRNWRINQD